MNGWRFKNKTITVFSNCCIGGFVYQNMNICYQSPTISVNILPSDFIKMMRNPHHYFSQNLVQTDFNNEYVLHSNDKRDFPCAILDDIKLFMEHELTFEEGKEKWDRRLKRINYAKSVVIMFVKKRIFDKRNLRKVFSVISSKGIAF